MAEITELNTWHDQEPGTATNAVITPEKSRGDAFRGALGSDEVRGGTQGGEF